MNGYHQRCAQLRETVLAELVLPNLARLRAGNAAPWGQPHWYRALEQSAPAAAPFPVQSPGWHGLEQDRRNGVHFRFFTRHAQLHMALPRAPATLMLTVPHVALDAALDQLRIDIGGVPVPFERTPHADACCALALELDEAVLAPARRCGRLSITFSTPVAAVPALLYPESRDTRLLSLAVSYPRLLEA